MQCKLQNLTGQPREHVPDSQQVGSEAALEGKSVGADTFDWCSGRSRSPLSSCHEAEKGNPTQGMCTVTVTRGAWRGHGRGGQEREVDAEQQGENVKGPPGVGPCRGGSTGGSG